MRFRDDDRAQSVQVGAILLFATFVIGLSIYQATVVPSQNADVEYKHSQTVQNQLTDVRNALIRTASTGNTQPVSVTLGTQYPSRAFLMNPPPATGTLRTSAYSNGTVTVSNVEATNVETADYVNGSWTASTKYLEYAPNYHEYDNPPHLLYEFSVLSNYYPDVDNGTAIPLTDQLLVDNETRTITLVTLNGSLSTTRSSSVSVAPETLSAPYQRVQVTNATSEPVEVSMPAVVSASQLEDRTDLGDHPGVLDVRDHPTQDNRVVVEVDWEDQFTLQTARVGVGSGTTNPPVHYLTLVENRDDTVTLEARDRFNNAESGVEVGVSDPSLFVDAPRTTNENGRVTFEVADNESGSAVFSILENSTTRERVRVAVSDTGVGDGGDRGDGGDGGGPTPDVRVAYVDPGTTDLRTVALDGTTVTYDTIQIKGIGPANTDIDGDGDHDVPYVDNNQNLRIVDAGDAKSTLDGSGSVYQGRLGVGDWDEDGTVEVVYVRGDLLYQAEPGDSPEQVTDCNPGGRQCTSVEAAAVAGVGDFDDNGDRDIVYVGSDNNEIRFVDGTTDESTGVTVNTATAVSNLADLDGDTDLEVAHQDNDDKGIDLVDAGGDDGSFAPGHQVSQAPMAAVDWDGDGVGEVVYASNDGDVYYWDPVDGTVDPVEDDTGSQVTADTNQGTT